MTVKQRLLIFITALLLFININSLSADSISLSTQLNTLIKQNSQNKGSVLRPDLAKQLKAYQQNTDALLSNKTSSKDKTKGKTSNPTVIIDAIAQHETSTLLADLVKHGMQPLGVNGRIISGQIPVSALAAIQHLPSLNAISLSRIITSAGSTTSLGDVALHSDHVRQSLGYTGEGITVGVISDSYDCLGGAAQDKITQDLPADAFAMQDAVDCEGKKDEGRALMQIVYDIAPKAKLIFHSGSNGLATTANAIIGLVNEHQVDVIVDDFKSLSANFFQQDSLSQAIEQVTQAGVVYVTAAGNSGRNAYQSAYREVIDSTLALNAHDFDPSDNTDIYQRIHVPEGIGFQMLLQWDEPAYTISGAPGTQSDLDLFIFNQDHSELRASSTFGNVGRDPVESVYFYNPPDSGETEFDILITKASGQSPSALKYIILNSIDGIIQEYHSHSSGMFGHANSASAITVGAANHKNTPAFGVDPPLLQYYSSAGGTPFILSKQGERLDPWQINNKPDVVAPDNVSTTFFGEDTDDDGFPNISGSSAAAPHIAGVVALLLQAKPMLQPSDVKTLLQQSAIDIVQIDNEAKTPLAQGFDLDSGYGLVNAQQALALAQDYQPSEVDEPTALNPVVVNDASAVNGGSALDGVVLWWLLVLLVVRRYYLFHSEKPKSNA